MKYLLLCIALLAVIISCDDTTAPEPPVGYFIVDSMFVTFVVEEGILDQITSSVSIRYVYHFEKSRGYVKCRVVNAVFQEEDSKLCSMESTPHATDVMLEDTFGFGSSSDYSHLDSTTVSIQIEGFFTGGECYDSQSDRCRFVWKDEVTVPVESRLE